MSSPNQGPDPIIVQTSCHFLKLLFCEILLHQKSRFAYQIRRIFSSLCFSDFLIWIRGSLFKFHSLLQEISIPLRWKNSLVIIIKTLLLVIIPTDTSITNVSKPWEVILWHDLFDFQLWTKTVLFDEKSSDSIKVSFQTIFPHDSSRIEIKGLTFLLWHLDEHLIYELHIVNPFFFDKVNEDVLEWLHLYLYFFQLLWLFLKYFVSCNISESA